jgi:hypothetical protein
MNKLDNFEIPTECISDNFIVRKMCASDIEIDYLAVTSSVDIIKRQMGGDWPSNGLTKEDDLIDLSWHQREFEYESSFAYIVTNLEGNEPLGCLYVFPKEHIFNKDNPDIPEGCDVVLDMWVTQKAYDEGFYPILYNFLENWIKQWPYEKPYFSNILKP